MKLYQKIGIGLGIVGGLALGAIAPAYAQDKAQPYVEEKPTVEQKLQDLEEKQKIQEYKSKLQTNLKSILTAELDRLTELDELGQSNFSDSQKELDKMEISLTCLPGFADILCKACNEDPEMYKTTIKKEIVEIVEKEQGLKLPETVYGCEYICTLTDLLNNNMKVEELNDKIEDCAENYEFLKAGDLTLVKLSYRIFKSAKMFTSLADKTKQIDDVEYVMLGAFHLINDGLDIQKEAAEFYLKGGDVKNAKALSKIGALAEKMKGLGEEIKK